MSFKGGKVSLFLPSINKKHVIKEKQLFYCQLHSLRISELLINACKVTISFCLSICQLSPSFYLSLKKKKSPSFYLNSHHSNILEAPQHAVALHMLS